MTKKIFCALAAIIMAFAAVGLSACGNEAQKPDDNPPAKEKLERLYNEGMTYDKYELDTYIYPYWRGNVVYNETALFVGKNDASPLLYKATEILSVRSYDLKTVYEEGKDYTYDAENNLLKRTENSAIPYVEEDDWYLPADKAKEQNATSWPKKGSDVNGGGYQTYLFFREGSYISNLQVAITYKHNEYASEEWEVPAVFKDKFTRLTAKLEAKEPVKVGYLGDSVTFGAIASGMPGSSFEPNAEIYARMMTSYMAKHFDNENITYVNPSVGGKDAAWGRMQAESNEQLRGLDFCVVAFGLNDLHTPYDAKHISYAIRIGEIVENLQAHNPDIEVLIVAPMIGNPESTVYYDIDRQMQALYNEFFPEGEESEYKNVGIAEVTKMHRQLYHKKGERYRDITANNINHPNDFAGRVYTMTCLTAMFGHDYFLTENSNP